MKKGFTLIEVLITITIIAILITVTTVSLNTTWINNQIDRCESQLRDVSNSLKNYLTDYGNIIIQPDTNYQTVLNETLDVLNKQYLSFEFTIDKIALDKRNVRFVTKNQTDPWGNKYRLSIYTYDGIDAQSVPGVMVVSSSGINGVFNSGEYKNGIYDDDILAVIEPRLQ